MTFPAWRSALFRLRITVEMPPAIGCCRAYGAPRATITARGNDHVDVAAAAAGTNKALPNRAASARHRSARPARRDAGQPGDGGAAQSAKHTRARAELPRVALGAPAGALPRGGFQHLQNLEESGRPHSAANAHSDDDVANPAPFAFDQRVTDHPRARHPDAGRDHGSRARLYLRFTLSYRDVEELLAERGVEISYETARRWVLRATTKPAPDAIGAELRQRTSGTLPGSQQTRRWREPDSNYRSREGGRWRLGSLICWIREFSRCRLFRLSGAEVFRRNSGRIGGFEEGEFEADSTTREVAAQICLSRPDTV